MLKIFILQTPKPIPLYLVDVNKWTILAGDIFIVIISIFEVDIFNLFGFFY